MTINIWLATKDEYPEVATFIDDAWKKNHAYVRDKKLFDWSFSNPFWTEPDYSLSLALDADRIVGMLGIIPFPLNDHGRDIKACWLVNWLVIPEARKGRIGLALLDVFAKRRSYSTISFGINDTIAKLYAALKWQHMPRIPRMEWINPESLDAEAFMRAANPEASGSVISKYISRARLNLLPKSHSIASMADWDMHGWPEWRDKTIGCSRASDFLTWRYTNHPSYRYEMRVIPDGDQFGLIVWRIEMAQTESGTYPFTRIVEFLPASLENAKSLLCVCLHASRQASAIGADFYCYSRPICEMLGEIGFYFPQESAEVTLPNYTQPVAKSRDIRSSIKIAGQQADLSQSPDWYWTRADSDQDRPN